MKLYTIGDLHLSMTGEKPMDCFGETWRDHPRRLEEGFRKVGEDDVTVLCGDLSWAMSLEGAREDFAFISRLPGRKIILKGNHDYWWTTASRTYRFFEEQGFEGMQILHNNAFLFGDVALCGTRGWFFEEEKGGEHDRKMLAREVLRLETSLKAAGDREKIVFLHYPPVYQHYRCEEILRLLEQYQVKQCFYGHIHGRGCPSAFSGWLGCTRFRLVSADWLRFEPLEIMDLPPAGDGPADEPVTP